MPTFSLTTFLRVSRWPNLAIIAITLLLSHFLFIRPFLFDFSAPLTSGFIGLLLLIVACVFTASAGYFINDLFDQQADEINKGQEASNRSKLHSTQMKWGATIASLTAIGAAVAYLYLFSSTVLLYITIAALVLLFLYAIKLQCWPIIGNVVVALLCGLVPLLPLVLEFKGFELSAFENPMSGMWIGGILGGYGIFAFLSTWFREIAKDMEDIEGDKSVNCQTLAVRFGFKTSKVMACIVNLLLSLSISFGIFMLINVSAVLSVFSMLVLLGYNFFLLIILMRARSKPAIHQVSNASKIFMVLGLIILPIIKMAVQS